MKMSESIIELAKALSKFQGEVKQPVKDGTNPHFRSNYVTLQGTVEAITSAASPNGLSFMQFPINDGERIGVYTLLMHSSGEWIESDPIFATPGKKDAQAVGSVITYMKRYSLSAAFGIASDLDDDGEASMNRGGQQSSYSSPQQSKPSYTPPSNIKVPESAQEAGSITLGFGKNKGKTLKQLWVEDKNYLMWLLDNDKTDEAIKEGISLMQVAAAQAAAEQKMQ